MTAKYTQLCEGVLGNMARSAVVAGALGLSALAGPQASGADIPTIDRTLNAIYDVEVGGVRDKQRAVGDNGNAKGIFQIWPSVIQDVNRVYKTSYTHDDMFDPKKATDVAKKYLTYYGKVYKRNTGKEPTPEIYARMWNGGPKGYKKSATDKYWSKVQKNLR